MNNRVFYKVFCIISLIITIYMMVRIWMDRTPDTELLVVFVLLAVVVLWGMYDLKVNNNAVKRLENELKMYTMYIKPLEELSKEIRAKQHEFDNHINAIVNIHHVVDNYDELVKRQSEYAESIRTDSSRQLLPLLKISDKVLAGFLYSKLVNIPDDIQLDISVHSYEIISPVSEHQLIEMVGTLVDNAIEASTKLGHIIIELDSHDDKLVFTIKNRVEGINYEQIGHFFEKGYSTKSNASRRGLGLYNAKKIAEKQGGDITVAIEKTGKDELLCFNVEI